jgi:hypothetical protein
MTPEQVARLEILRCDFGQYAPRALKIKAKSGNIVDFILNEAQEKAWAMMREQERRTGKIRAIILKGRQQGLSTMTEGLLFQRTSLYRGKEAVVMAHKADSSAAIFGMVRRYYDECPRALKPKLTSANAAELKFGVLGSGYRVATAGSSAIGRGWTAQFLHASEFAFWDNAAEHFSGIGQAIPDADGTIVVIESTANAPGDEFHKQWQRAEAGKSDYIAIFIPWFIQSEYQRPVPKDFALSEEEIAYMEAHGLKLEQMAWRRNKIEGDFGGDVNRFCREYPATPAEAFIDSGKNPYIKGELVTKARKQDPKLIENSRAPLVLGVDVARFGDDRTVFVPRKGRVTMKPIVFNQMDTMETAGNVARWIMENDPDKVFVDVIGIGAGVVDRLHELGYRKLVQGVASSEAAHDKEQYRNKRAEMWGEMREYLSDVSPVSLPDLDDLHGDLVSPSYSYDSAGRLLIESKENMKKRGVRSPDIADALALTFSYPVAPRKVEGKTSMRDRLKGKRTTKSPMAA